MRLVDPQTDDIGVLAALHASAFADAWSAGYIRDLLTGPGVFAYLSGQGFILARAAGGEAEILTLAVAPESRRQGIARALVMKAAAHAYAHEAGALFLEVACDNQGALKLYQGLGFKRVGLRKAYYAGKDAEVLKAFLPLPNPDDFA